MNGTTKFIADLVIEFAYNCANTMVGYMTAKEVLELPTPAALVIAALMGVIGMANHYRALRRTP